MIPFKNLKNSAEFVCKLIAESKMPRNQIAAASGLTNTYIRDLEQGNIANVGREKLIQFAVALNLNLSSIDELLRVFDRANLSEDDIPLFLAAGIKSKTTTAIFPLRDFYAYELAVYSQECIPGDQVMVNDRPTVCLRQPGHRTFTERRLVEAHPVYEKLLETIGAVRRKRLEENLEKFQVTHYICRQCLADYVLNSGNAEENRWRKQHVRNLIICMDRYPNLNVHLTGVCAYTLFSIKKPRDGSKVQVHFCARPGHFVAGERPGRLSGFFTINPMILQTFQEELMSIKGWVFEEYADRHHLMEYMDKLISG